MNSKKVAIVTGASRGIGRAAALKFAENGFRVTLVGLDKQELEQVGRLLEKNYKTESIICAGDLGEAGFLQQIVERTLSQWKRIDVLVNNAAWRTITTMRTMEMDIWERTIKVCLTAPAFLSKWVAEAMESAQIAGTIINVSSIMSQRPAGNSPAYVAAKGALESLTFELAVTYGRKGIRVLCVNPGFIDTEMSKDYVDDNGHNISNTMIGYLVAATPLGRGGSTEEIANAIYWLSTGQASFMTGAVIPVDGGFIHNMNDYAIKKMQFPDEF